MRVPTPNRVNPKKSTQRHIITKPMKISMKAHTLKSRGKKILFLRDENNLRPADSSVKAMEARRKWHDIFQAWKENTCELRILFPMQIFFRNEDRMKTLSKEVF